ncbi:MAG: polysaccharide biosynthesis tyrosine autokinase [Deltaproteobacteria bacterium]|nr:polysaccharide biosynthesis tyrosine autokinase [Deltaproteobacteria bacterium]
MAQYDINLREYWRIIKKRRFFIILVAILLTLFSVALSIVRAPTPLYEATCSIKFEKAVSPLGLYTKFISFGAGSEIETQMAVIKGYPVFKKVAFAMGFVSEENYSDRKLAQIITRLQSQVKVTREGYSNIVNITATATSPEFAANLANQTAHAYKETHAKEVNQRTGEAIRFIKGQLEKVSSKLRKSEDRLRRFKENKNVISLTSQSDNLLSRASVLEARLAETVEAKREFEDIIRRIKEAPIRRPSSKESFYSEKTTGLYKKLNSRLIDLMIKRDTLLVQYTTAHPQVIETDKQIAEIKERMINELESQWKSYEKEEKDLRKEIARLRGKIQSIPNKGLELARLEKEVERNAEIYSLLESKYQEALIQNAERPEEVVIVRPAFEPFEPINPPNTVPSGFMGAMIGLVFGLVFAFIVETFDTSIGAIDEVEQTLGLAVMGLIPHIDEKDIQPDLKEQYERELSSDTVLRSARLIPNFGPQSVLAESFRSLRMNVQFSALEQEIKSIVITSAIAEEGKTIVAANLAIAMAEGGLKTLLIETDLRKPTIYRMFGLEATPGLTEYLLSNYDLSETIKTVTDMMMGKMNMDKIILTPGIDNLHIMTCGTIPLNPAELMESKKFKDLLAYIRKQYDVILMDAPPLVSAADALVLAAGADGVLLTYRAGKVARGILKRVKTQLEQVKANIIGVVLNGVKAEVSLDFAELKKYKYYTYYKEEGKKKKKRRKMSTVRVLAPILVFVALIFLIVGILWQTGIIDLDKYIFKYKTPPKEKVSSLSSKLVPAEPAQIKIPMPAPVKGPLQPRISANYPYTIITGSFRDLERANEAVSFHRGRDQAQSYWSYVDLGEKGKWYRVCVGLFETRQEAERFKNKLGIPGSRVLKTAYTNEIGYFSSKEEMEERAVSLKKVGYMPYSIEVPQRGYRLLIGAFVTKEGAIEMARILKDDGIESRVVLR